MTLTPGATLQNGKYEIQAVLEQNEWGVTYRASQVDSAQTIIVQTLNLPDPIQLEPDQLLAVVRQHLSSPPHPQVSVLACFIESNLLFVVLKPTEAELDPNVHHWFAPLVNSQSPLSTNTLSAEVPELTPASLAIASPETPASLPPAESNLLESNPPESHPLVSDSPSNGHDGPSPQPTVIQPVVTALQPPAASPATLGAGKTHNGQFQKESVSTKTLPAKKQPPQPSLPRATAQTKVTVLTAPPVSITQKPKFKLWVPVALGITSIAAGLAGAGFGWALRTQSPNSTAKPSLLSPILNNEQSFPPIEGWVGDDPIDLSTPLATPEESERFERRPATAGRYPGRESLSEDIAPVRSRSVPPVAVEEAPPVSAPDSLPPDPLDASGSDPSLYNPPEPAVAPTPDAPPIPTKVKPIYVPPANPPAEPPPPSVQTPVGQPPNINGALSTPGVQ